MATVIGIRFKKAGKVYYFDPSDVWPNPGDCVVVETSRGVEMGEVVTGAREVDDGQIVAPLKKVLRVASWDTLTGGYLAATETAFEEAFPDVDLQYVDIASQDYFQKATTILAGGDNVDVIDITHGIPRHDVRAGGLALARAA